MKKYEVIIHQYIDVVLKTSYAFDTNFISNTSDGNKAYFVFILIPWNETRRFFEILI